MPHDRKCESCSNLFLCHNDHQWQCDDCSDAKLPRYPIIGRPRKTPRIVPNNEPSSWPGTRSIAGIFLPGRRNRKKRGQHA